MSEMAGEHPDEVITTVKIIRETMDTIGKSLTAIENYGKRTRQISVALILSLVLDILLTIGVAVLSTNAISQSDSTRAIQHSNCLSANEARADQIKLWNTFIAIATEHPSPNETPQQKRNAQEEITQILSFVKSTFHPLSC